MSLANLEHSFNEKTINKRAIRTQPKQLNFFNRHYIMEKWKSKDPKMIEEMCEYVRKIHKLSETPETLIKDTIHCIVDRITNYEDFSKYEYFFKDIDFNQL